MKDFYRGFKQNNFIGGSYRVEKVIIIDARWMDQLVSGNERAWEDFYEVYKKRLYGYLLSLLLSKSDAEDVLGEVFMKLIQKRSRLKRVENINAYLYTLARHEAFRFLSRRKGLRAIKSFEDAPPELVIPPSQKLEDREEAEKLNMALGLLPPEQREVIMLKLYNELAFAEIASLLQVPLDTLASRYRYGLEKLRKLLSDQPALRQP